MYVQLIRPAFQQKPVSPCRLFFSGEGEKASALLETHMMVQLAKEVKKRRIVSLPVGRSTSQNEIVVKDSGVSRKHGEFLLDTMGDLSYKDRVSTNGSLLNGTAIIGKKPLRARDVLTIGSTKITIPDKAAIVEMINRCGTTDTLVAPDSKTVSGFVNYHLSVPPRRSIEISGPAANPVAGPWTLTLVPEEPTVVTTDGLLASINRKGWDAVFTPVKPGLIYKKGTKTLSMKTGHHISNGETVEIEGGPKIAFQFL